MAPTGEHIVETKIIWNKTVRARSHQYIRTEGSVPSPKCFLNPSIGIGRSGDDIDGQFHSTVSHLKSGRDTIPSNVPVVLAATDLVLPEQDPHESTIYHRGK